MFLFAIIMNSLTDIRKEAPWSMMFADNVVLCCGEKTKLEEDLERWRIGLEKREMKVSRAKTENMCLNGASSRHVWMQDHQLSEIREFKYFGGILQTDEGVEVEIS